MKDTDEMTRPHLSLAQLLSYHQDQATEEEKNEIEEHFVRCPACTEQSIDLARFLRPEEEDASEAHEPARVRWRENPRVLQAVAAVLLAVSVVAPSIVWKSAQLHRARFLEAEPNVPVLNLEAAAFRRDAGQPPPPPALALPGTLLILVPEREPVSADYTVAILTQEGKQIWSNPGLRPTDLGQFHLRLPRNLSPGAIYRIRILDPKQDHAEELLVQIASPASP